MLQSTLLEHGSIDRKKHLISLNDMRINKVAEKVIKEYQEYLSELNLQQINHEIDYLLSEINLSTYDKEAFWKLDSVMQLLEQRSSTGAAKLIRKIREEVYDRVRLMYHLPLTQI